MSSSHHVYKLSHDLVFEVLLSISLFHIALLIRVVGVCVFV
jgi:hypothetical protein